jgi:hypothetical protein
MRTPLPQMPFAGPLLASGARASEARPWTNASVPGDEPEWRTRRMPAANGTMRRSAPGATPLVAHSNAPSVPSAPPPMRGRGLVLAPDRTHILLTC